MWELFCITWLIDWHDLLGWYSMLKEFYRADTAVNWDFCVRVTVCTTLPVKDRAQAPEYECFFEVCI